MATGGLYAPTIRHHNGITYIACTNFIHQDAENYKLENFVLSTSDIWSDEWSDPIYFDFHGIDPDLFWDDDGRVYVVGSAWGDKTTISCQEIDIKAGVTLQSPKTVWEGFTKVIPEGPHLYRKDGWYYLLVAEGGTSEDHCIVIARSSSVWGPYHSCPNNPILPKARGNQYAQHNGHGDLFQDSQGSWWMTCLGVRKEDGRYHMGRETFITRVEWPIGEWPAIEPIHATIPSLQQRLPATLSTKPPSRDLVYIRDPDLLSYKIEEEGRIIKMKPSGFDLTDIGHPISFIGRRQRALKGAASVSLHLPPTRHQEDTKIGIGLYKDEHRFARVFWDTGKQMLCFEFQNRAKSKSYTVTTAVSRDMVDITLILRYTHKSVEFLYRAVDGTESTVHMIDTLDLTGYDFIGPVIGLFAVSNLEVKQSDYIVFSQFQVD